MSSISTPARPSAARRLARWAAAALGGLASLIVVAALAIFAISEARIQRTYTTQPAPIRIPTDDASIAHGRRLVVHVLACVDCHGDNLAGKTIVDDPAIGRASAANLTPGRGGVLPRLSDADLVRILRHGVRPDGRSLLVMPVEDYVALSEADMGAAIAYLRTLPPVDSELPPNELRPLGRALLALGQASLLSAETVPQTGGFPAATPAGPTAEYGRYLARTSGCMGCHGATLSGGPLPGGPPDAPTPLNITPAGAVQGWTDAQLADAIRSGRRPDGSLISPFMPYRLYAGMSDDEIAALVRYLRSVPPKPFGGR